MKSEIKPKFKKGDLIIGNDRANCYNITKSGWIGEVVKIYNNAQMEVKGIECSDYVSFQVEADFFNLYKPKFEVGDTVEVITNKPIFGSGGVNKGDIGKIKRIIGIHEEVVVDFGSKHYAWSAKNYELKKVEEVIPKSIHHSKPKVTPTFDAEICLKCIYLLDKVKPFGTTSQCDLLHKKDLRVLVNKYTENPYKYSIGEIIDDLIELL